MLDDGSPPGTFVNWRAAEHALDAAEARDLQPAAARFLLATVAKFTNGHPGFPSYETLAQRTGLSVERTRHYLKRLVDEGYLVRSRRPRPHGGWGQPQWQVVTGDHLVPGEVVTGDQSSGHGRPLASGHGRPQKRRLSTTVVQPPLVGLVEGGSEERTEEKDPPPPQPVKTRTPTKQSTVIDLLRAGGCTPALREQDFAAIKASPLTAEQIAEVYLAIAQGRWTDTFMAKGLTVQFAISRWDGYQASLKAPANGATNGRPLTYLQRREAERRAKTP